MKIFHVLAVLACAFFLIPEKDALCRTFADEPLEDAIARKTPGKPISKGDFLIFFEGAIGYPTGKVLDEEKNAFSLTGEFSDGTIQTARPYHMSYCYGGAFEYLILDRVGLQAGYNRRIINQSMDVENSEYEDPGEGGTLLSYDLPFVGMSFYILRANEVAWYLAGRPGLVLNGKISPLPSAFDFFNFPGISYKVTGFNMGGGTGIMAYTAHFLIGAQVMVNWLHGTMGEEVYLNVGRSFSLITYDFYLTLGVRI